MFSNFSAIDISASGLAAERLRMEITANNIANAGSTMTQSGTPYRKQTVVFASAMESAANNHAHGLSGVRVIGIESDPSEFPKVFNPSHPHADADGFVLQSNVKVPVEMVDLITASRSYEANAKAISLLKEMVEQTLALLRGGR